MEAHTKSERVAIDVRVAEFEAESLVQAVSGLSRRSRREIDGDRPVVFRVPQGFFVQCLTHAMPTCLRVDDDVLDPGTNTRGNAEHRQGERAHDPTVQPGHEEGRRSISRDLLECCSRRRRIRGRQLRNQVLECGHDLVVDDLADGNFDCHSDLRVLGDHPTVAVSYRDRMTTDALSANARALGGALEPFVGQVYFSPECHRNYAALGFQPSPGEMNGVALPEGVAYFTSRGSLMGQVPGELVAAAFAVFNPIVVIPSVTAGWKITDATTVCAARRDGAIAQLERIIGAKPGGVAKIRPILERAVSVLRPEGRPLFAGTLSQDVPASDLGACWHFGDMLREFRGDSHTAAWIAAGLDATEIGLLTELFWGLPLKSYSRTRGWSEDDYASAIDRLESRGLISEGAFTNKGRELRESVEVRTDEQMHSAMRAIGDDFAQLVDVLGAWSRAVQAMKGYPESGPHELAEAAARR